MQIEYRSDESIKESTQEFLRRYHPDDTIPVPIEEIIEFDLGLDIIPVPGLSRDTSPILYVKTGKCPWFYPVVISTPAN